MRKIVILSGFSGVGKGTVTEALMQEEKNVWLSISDTDRERRNNRDRYNYIQPKEFLTNIAACKYLEYNRYGQHWYGTPRQPVMEALREGKTVLLEIDIHGLRQILRQKAEFQRLDVQIISVFLSIDFAELESRLRGRGDSPEEIAKRMRIADQEKKYLGEYDLVIENRNLSDTVKRLHFLLMV